MVGTCVPRVELEYKEGDHLVVEYFISLTIFNVGMLNIPWCTISTNKKIKIKKFYDIFW